MAEPTTETTDDAEVEQPEHEVCTTEETKKPEPDTLPREYVKRLPDEAARYRQRVSRQPRRHALARTRDCDRRLTDLTDLGMPESADPRDTEAVTAALDGLLSRKPHLASRRPRFDVGQGVSGQSRTITSILPEPSGSERRRGLANERGTISRWSSWVVNRRLRFAGNSGEK